MKILGLVAMMTGLMGMGAMAAEGLLTGNYGNEEGCDYLASGDLNTDSLLILTPTKISNYGQTCHFVDMKMLPAGEGGYSDDILASSICGYEGEDILGAEHFVLSKAWDRDAYRIFTADATLWAELDACGE